MHNTSLQNPVYAPLDLCCSLRQAEISPACHLCVETINAPLDLQAEISLACVYTYTCKQIIALLIIALLC
ncbi:hypothetical protein ABBQ38_006408 [Trebouxia sp. C0009 RCD-2024]